MFAFFGLLCYNDMYAKNMCFFAPSREGHSTKKIEKGKKV